MLVSLSNLYPVSQPTGNQREIITPSVLESGGENEQIRSKTTATTAVTNTAAATTTAVTAPVTAPAAAAKAVANAVASITSLAFQPA